MSAGTAPTWVPIWLACKACEHQWDDWQPCNCPIETWAAHVRTLHCPRCGKGSRHVVLRAEPLGQGDAS
jgi:hypothetical protein